MRSRLRERQSLTGKLLGLGCVGVLSLALGAGAQDFNGAQDIVLGDKATAAFDANMPFDQVHLYRFFAPDGSKLWAQAKADKGTDLDPDIRLLQNGEAVDLGKKLKDKGKSTSAIKNFKLLESSWYELEVTAAAGSGAYELRTKPGLAKGAKGTIDTGEFPFDAVAGSTMKLAKVSGPKGSTPVFTSLTGPDGADIAIPVGEKKLKNIALPDTGTYTFDYSLGGVPKLQPGQGKVSVKVVPAKPKNEFANGAQAGLAMGMIDYGDPHNDAAAPGFVGSDACRQCHPDHWEGVVNGFHNSKMRTWAREGAAGYNIPPNIDAEFKAGTNMQTAHPGVWDEFDSLDVSYVPGDDMPYKIKIGANTYEVMYVMGGNGPWKQRYVVKIDRTHFITPIQYNEKNNTWVAYHNGDWTADGVPTAKKNSWERRCAGCHATGVLLEWDEPTGEYLTGYAQMNVGCEACHGAGETHANGPTDANILNPRDLMDGTVAGVQAADLTCGQCHNRGGGDKPMDGLVEAPSGSGYPWDIAAGIFTPGMSETQFWGEYYTEGTGQYWLEKDNPMGFAPTPDRDDDTWVASSKHHQQYLDLHNGPHSPDKGYDGACFDCHDAHAGKDRKHMVAKTIERSGNTYTDIENDNNKICMACHNGHGDFANVTSTDVNDVTNDFAPASVVTAVVNHMTDQAGMPIDIAAYDPAGDGTGRCSKCHMPKTAKSAIYTTDKDGHQVGDIHSHTFWPIWPSVSEQVSITNSCNGCHPIDNTDGAADKIDEWVSDPDADDTFHADAPRNFQNGVANAESAGGGMACSACHTTQGFIYAQVEGNTTPLLNADTVEAEELRFDFVKDSIGHHAGITCKACHGKDENGLFAAGDNPLRFPKGDLCGKCHMNETVQLLDFVEHGEIVRHPQQQMLDGVEGGEVFGESYSNSTHSGFDCVDCHYDTDNGGTHTFMPNVASCNQGGICHTGLPDFNRTAAADYDGDGSTDGLQDEIHGCLELLRDAIVAAGSSTSTGAVVTYDGTEYFLIDGDRSNTGALHPVNDLAIMRAIFNHYWVEFDASGGMHNAEYALQLIQKAWEDLTGNDWNTVTGGVER